MNKQKKITSRIVAALLTCALLSTSALPAFAAPGETLYEKVNGDRTTQTTVEEDYYYAQYLEDTAAQGATDYTGEPIELDIAGGTLSPQGNFIKDDIRSNSNESRRALVWNTDDLESVQWTVEVAQSGYYNIEVDYLSITGSTTAPQRDILIDGEEACKEMNVYSFPRVWEDDGEVWVNQLGDEVRPRQKEVIEWQTTRLNDSQGKYAEPLRYYLTAGTHTITMVYVNEPIAIAGVRLVAPKHYPSYAEVKQSYQDAGYQYATQSTGRIQGESALYKSDPALRLQTDNDPKMDPVASGTVVYNSMGGSVWNGGNDTITWTFEAPESGIYKLSMRMYQAYTDGLPIYRQIMIDGEVPYAEFLDYRIDYTEWTYADIVDSDGNPFEIYLEKGTHTFTMSVKLGEYADIISTLERDSYNLSNTIQDIIKVTTVNPDVNFDYEIDEKVPSVITDLETLSASLEHQINAIMELSEKRPSAVNNLSMIKTQIDAMIKDPMVIARGLSELMDSQSSMATWISDFQNSPLNIDYFEFKPVSAETEDYHSNIFERIGVGVKTFALSFVKDYESVGGGAQGEDAVTLDVWVSRAKEWAEVLQTMIDEEFSPDNNINIKMNIVPTNMFTTSGVIMLAIAAGNAPDVALGVSASVPFEYGIRGAMYNLANFEDYPEVADRFLDGIMIPFTHKDEVYALPETMDFSVLFYRTDILQSLNLEVPDTWEELYSRILPILKKNGMDFYYDGTVSSVSGAVSAAFHSLLYQNGGSYYTEDGLQSALDTPQAFSAFQQFTDLYRIYDVPVSASLYTRFRSGTIPIGVSSFTTYIQLTAAAPEISGKWDVALLPGVEQEDGTINRSYGGNTTAAVILSGTEHKDEAWKFLKWYTEADTQTQYANDIASTVGAEARWCSANLDAFDALSWESSLKEVIMEQRQWYVDMPNVIGGYITPRYIENARVRTVVQGMQYRDSLEKTVKDINRELTRKNEEFAMRESKEAEKAAKQ